MRSHIEILKTGLLRSEIEEIADGGPLQVRCAAHVKKVSGELVRCPEIFDVNVNVELGVYQGSCPKHGSQNFCITIMGSAGVANFVATEQDFKDFEASKAIAPPEPPPAPGPGPAEGTV
jgi:hypothetical protein